MPAKKSGKTGLARRYAAALFELAKEQGALDAVSADLTALGEMFAASSELVQAARNPVLDTGEVGRAFDTLLEMAKAHDVTRQTVRVMAENRRLWLLPRVAEAFGHLLAAEKGEIEVEVTSAAPLSPKQKEALETTFKKAFSSKVLLKEQVNAKILGGLQVKVGSEMIDASVEGSLDRLSRLQKAANLKG